MSPKQDQLIDHKSEADKTVRNIRRQTRRNFSSEEKIRIVLAGLHAEEISRARAKFYKKSSMLRVEALRDEIQNRYNQSVIDVQIYSNIVRDKRTSIENHIFENIEQKFPINLFSDCCYTDPYSIQPLSQFIRYPITTFPNEFWNN